MRNLRCIGLLAIVFLALPITSHDVFAEGAKVAITVSATVLEYINMDLKYQTGNVNVTADNITRGYVDVDAGTIYRIKTNSREGYFLSFNSISSTFTKVLVIDNGRTVELYAGYGSIHMQYAGGWLGEIKKLSYRLYLADNTRPGLYQWPLDMVVG